MSETAPPRLDRQLRLAALPTAPRVARAFVRHTLWDWRVPEECYHDIELLTAELVTNAVQHTGRADGPPVPYPTETVAIVGVRVMRHGHVIRLEVWDRDPSPPMPTEPHPDDESGRGLLIVEALCQAWGTRPSRAGGKVVWCELARDMTAPMRPPKTQLPVSAAISGDAHQATPDIALLERVLLGLRQLKMS